MARVSQANLRTQYEQCYLHMRAHMQAVWQIPTTATAVMGGLILGAFEFAKTLLVREGVLILGTLLFLAVYISLIKHDFYYQIERNTLDHLEDQMSLRRIQRTSEPDCTVDYWYSTKGREYRLFEETSAAKVFRWVMSLMLLVLVFILLVTPFTSPLPPW
jgi:hypothetical protein